MKKEFIKQIRAVLRILDRELYLQNNASCCNGISLAQCHTLLEIEKEGELSVSELAKKLSLDKSTVSRTVDGLVNIQMVDRITPKENRRKALVNLTDSGQPAGSGMCGTIRSGNMMALPRLLAPRKPQDSTGRTAFKSLAGPCRRPATRGCLCCRDSMGVRSLLCQWATDRGNRGHASRTELVTLLTSTL